MASTRKYGGEGKKKFTWAPSSTKNGNGKKKSNNKKHTSSPSDTLSSASADSSSAEDQRFLILLSRMAYPRMLRAYLCDV